MQRRSSLVVSSLSLRRRRRRSPLPRRAQGTMTPSQPPPLPPAEPAPTPTQPPVVQQATPAPETEPPAEEQKNAHKGEVPAARTGFQIALRTGVAVPLGEVDKGDSMSDTFTPQVPIIADIGVKLIPELFLGGYVGISVGGVGRRDQEGAATRSNVDCTRRRLPHRHRGRSSTSLPDATLEPVGRLRHRLRDRRRERRRRAATSCSAALGGVEFAHFMGGARLPHQPRRRHRPLRRFRARPVLDRVGRGDLERRHEEDRRRHQGHVAPRVAAHRREGHVLPLSAARSLQRQHVARIAHDAHAVGEQLRARRHLREIDALANAPHLVVEVHERRRARVADRADEVAFLERRARARARRRSSRGVRRARRSRGGGRPREACAASRRSCRRAAPCRGPRRRPPGARARSFFTGVPFVCGRSTPP